MTFYDLLDDEEDDDDEDDDADDDDDAAADGDGDGGEDGVVDDDCDEDDGVGGSQGMDDCLDASDVHPPRCVRSRVFVPPPAFYASRITHAQQHRFWQCFSRRLSHEHG